MPSSPQPVDPAALDPFWAPLRRQHPDVRVVLLPPVPSPVTPSVPAPDAGGSATAARPGSADPALARAVVSGIDAEFARVQEVASARDVSLEALAPLWWSQADRQTYRFTLEAVARDLSEGSPVDVTGDLVSAWLDAGWDVVALDRPQPTLVATSPAGVGPDVAALTVTLAAYPTTLSVELVSAELVLSDEALAGLAAGPDGDGSVPR